jgi:transcriptional regulator with XRE-family HTH domain
VGISPSSSVQRARQELADRLREIRLEAGLTARALSAEAGWHEAKTSRIEAAKQVPSESDIRAWCEVCRAPNQAVDLIASSRAADSAYIEWRRMNRTGMRHLQENKRPL